MVGEVFSDANFLLRSDGSSSAHVTQVLAAGLITQCSKTLCLTGPFQHDTSELYMRLSIRT